MAVIQGDMREVLTGMEPESFDSCVCDPPYELAFMGRKWDSSGVAFQVEAWRAVWRVLKPGAYLVAFSGTRTQHRMVCAIEDAGFEIRDGLIWAYGSGFPKSLSASRAIDQHLGFGDTDKYPTPHTPEAKQWNGWGTALKPALEPICIARKPLSEGTVAANVLKHSTGALNIAACRVGVSNGQNSGCPASVSENADAARNCGNAVPDLPVGVPGAEEQAGNNEDQDLQQSMSVDRDEWASESTVARRALPNGGRVLVRSDGDGLPLGTQGGDGRDSRSASTGDGCGSPQERGQRGQPAGKSSTVRGTGQAHIGEPRGEGYENGSLPAALGREGEASASRRRYTDKGSTNFAATPGARGGSSEGRWPPNLLHDGSPEVLAAFARFGEKPSAAWNGNRNTPKTGAIYGEYESRNEAGKAADTGTAARFFPALGYGEDDLPFFYCGKATKADRAGSSHPTVKPIALIRWLCRLVTPPGGKILDPFGGSGTTAAAALREGFQPTLVELMPEHVADIERRLAMFHGTDGELFA